MARPNKATQAKRSRELKKQEKRSNKEDRRADRKQHKTELSRPEGGEDHDLAGIVPGPQKPSQ